MNERLAMLSEIHTEVWRQLARAPRDKHHAWRTPVLATRHGELADARTVVLREIDGPSRTLLIYTDERAGKVAQLQQHPLGTLVMWSSSLGWQLRCRVRLALMPSGLATSSRWARIKLSPAGQDYLSPLPPGAPLDAPQALPHEAVAREHFGVIEAQVESIDWLELHRDGHRRALFKGETSHWLQP